MKFKLRSMDADPQGRQSQIYHTQSSSSSSAYSYFAEQAIRGRPSGNFGGGGNIGVGPEILRGPSEMREAIQREVEKQRIREEIIAEEIARKRILEEEVRNELRMEREMMSMRSGGGFSSPFMPLSLPPSHSNMFEPRISHRQPIGLEERIVMSLDEKYGGHHREIRAFEVGQFQRISHPQKLKVIPTPLLEDTKKEVIDLGKPNRETLSGTKRKSTLPFTACSSESRSDGQKKKLKEEFSCAVCQVTATSERGLNEHLHGKKHQAKEAALIAQKTGAHFGLGVAPKKHILKPLNLALTTVNLTSLVKKSKKRKESVNKTPSTNKTPSKIDSHDKIKKDRMKEEKKREKFKFWCEMCQVGAFSEKVMNNHQEGKKHLTNLAELEKGKVQSEAPASGKTRDTDEKTETETKKAVVTVKEPDTMVEEDEDEVKTVKDDVEDVTAEVADTNVVGNLGDDMIETDVAEEVRT